MDEVKKELSLRDHLAGISRAGGMARSEKKAASSRRNAVLAFQARWPGRPLTPRLLEIERLVDDARSPVELLGELPEFVELAELAELADEDTVAAERAKKQRKKVARQSRPAKRPIRGADVARCEAGEHEGEDEKNSGYHDFPPGGSFEDES